MFRTSFRSKPALTDAAAAEAEDDLGLAAGGGGPLPVGRDLVAALIILFTNPTFVCIRYSALLYAVL